MNHMLEQLRSDATRILALLDQGFPFSLGADEKSFIFKETGRVLHKLDAIEQSILSIGLLGGTGVGKSTLMNALAGSNIASASHRRPHTDQVLIYRHQEASRLPFLDRSNVPWKEITHSVDSISRILLCDLPDFDSTAAENREHVLGFMEHLDVLVWVTSLEKYGDGRFYEFVKAAPKAKQNFVFVLNKLDLLFQENEVDGYDRLARTTSHFRSHLMENGIDEPLLFSLAAQPVLEPGSPAPWNQFPMFRNHIFQQRDIKEITGIRSANLDVELRGVFSILERESVHLRTAEQFIGESIRQMEEMKSQWMDKAKEAISLWLGKEWRALMLGRKESSALLGPGRAIDLIVREFRLIWKVEEGSSSQSPTPNPPESVLSLFRTQMEEVRDRITRQVLVHSLPHPWIERAESVIDIPHRIPALERALMETLAFQVQEPSFPRFRGFRVSQYMAYAALFILFLVAVGGRESWEAIIAHPDLGTALRLAVSWINTLFSTQGLAALGSYILINLYLGFRFFRRHRKLVEKATRKTVERGRGALLLIWEGQIKSLIEDLERFRDDIRAKLSFLEERK